MLALLLVAFSLGLSNFGASVSLGVGGSDAGTRMRVGLIFGLFETGMPVLGLLLGRGLAGVLGRGAHWAGGALLIATGVYAVIQAGRGSRGQAGREPGGQAGREPRGQAGREPGGQAGREPGGRDGIAAGSGRTGRLLVAGVALSIDNLAVGFGLGTYHVGIAVAAVVIGAVSVTMSLAGLELGSRLGARTGSRGELVGGLILVGVGAAIAANAF